MNGGRLNERVDLASLQARIKQASLAYGAAYGIDVGGDFAAMKLAEEAGEVMQAYIRLTGRSRRGHIDPIKGRHALGRELADLIGMAMIIAHDQGIDLWPMLAESWDLEGDRPEDAPP
jgi:NTP pyrophosphatase (non-canonical NTP hydrolase)